MAAPVVTPPVVRPRKRRWILKLFLALLLLLVIALAGVWGWFYNAAHSSLAQLDGTIAVPGLRAPVSVVRDAHGVPHLTAASLEDLFFAQGYVTAQDRLWQMDISRRYAGGELSEVLPATNPSPPRVSRATGLARPSPTLLDHDKRQRILRLRAVSERVAAQLPQRDRAFFEAYTRGVNAYIDQNRKHLPVEFRILGYEPKPWTVADSILVGVSMSQLLNPQYETEYWREKIAAKLSPELMTDLYPPSSWRDRPPGSTAANPGAAPIEPDNQTNDTKSPISRSKEMFPYRQVDGCESCVPGSNNWVVSGAHTVTGKPLLSNDMHLPHQLPGTWYEVHLHSGDFNVEGFSLPGLPFVVVGHNQRIAWGYTNLNPDVQDLMIENFNSSGEYETPSGWQKSEVVHEIIHVKKRSDVAFDVVLTRHGPIISDLFPGETRKIALQWMVFDTRSISIPLFDLDSAQNWQQFQQALSQFATPSQNVVYADVDGHIGYQAMGFVPVRASGDGTIPVSGADGKHDWTGYLPFDKLPSVYDPPSGVIATANSRITPDGYPYLLATQWFSPYRVERIYHVLESDKKFAPGDMLALQTDVTSEYDRFFANHFVYAIDHSSKATDRTRKAADVMRGFDGRMVADSAAPTITVKSRLALWKLLLEPKLGENWEDYVWSEQAVAIETIVQTQPVRWLPPGCANFDDLLTQAVELAIADAPVDLQSWKYGQEYPVEINHPLFGAIPVLRNWSGPGRHPQAGGSYTVKQVGRRFGPSERMTVDFSNLDGSTFNIVIGESGQIFSPYYMDHWDAWYGNKTFTLAYSNAAVQGARTHELILMPEK